MCGTFKRDVGDTRQAKGFDSLYTSLLRNLQQAGSLFGDLLPYRLNNPFGELLQARRVSKRKAADTAVMGSNA